MRYKIVEMSDNFMNRSRSAIQERRDNIQKDVRTNGAVYITALCEKYNVTDMTMRRDLAVLESEGALQRFRGGARAVNRAQQNDDNPFIIKAITEHIYCNAAQKDMIAREAAKLIEPGEVIFMNSGTTCLYILKHIAGKNVRIVSNNAMIALMERSADTELMVAGGEHFVRSQSYVGPLAKNIFMNSIATKCFLSVSGISSENGITCSSFQETEINNLMIKRCDGERIVIADGSKVGVAYNFISCKVADIDMLITDKTADSDELKKIKDRGVRVIIANG